MRVRCCVQVLEKHSWLQGFELLPCLDCKGLRCGCLHPVIADAVDSKRLEVNCRAHGPRPEKGGPEVVDCIKHHFGESVVVVHQWSLKSLDIQGRVGKGHARGGQFTSGPDMYADLVVLSSTNMVIIELNGPEHNTQRRIELDKKKDTKLVEKKVSRCELDVSDTRGADWEAGLCELVEFLQTELGL